MEYSNSRTLHSHVLKFDFIPNYIYWTKHGENRLIMDEGEEEEELDHADIIAQYGVLKKYVHSHYWPEGTIAKGYEIEEVIEFCVKFIPDLDPIGVPESQHEGRLSVKGILGKKVREMITSIKQTTHFSRTPHWWNHMSRYTRISYGPSGQEE